jgi:hypothetical protein
MSAVLDPVDHSPGTELAPMQPRDTAVMPGFNSNASWELAQRIGKAFAASSLVPQQYSGNLANCIVALEMANRMGASPLMVMQNLYIVHGNPGWSSKFLIASFNQCGRFSALRYEWTPDRTGCRAWAIEKATGERIDGPLVTLAMAKDEGWSTKSGSKWKTMPELMLMYRAAAFLIRTYAPEISMGLRTDDEIIDMGPADMAPAPRLAKAAEVGALLGSPSHSTPATPAFDYLAAHRRIEAATDREILALMADEYRDLADTPEREALLEAYRQRDAALAEG